MVKIMEEFDMVDFKFCDLFGQWQHLTVPKGNLNLKNDVIPFDGSSIRGFKEIHESDMTLIPDYSTSLSDPFSKNILSVICDIYEPRHNCYFDKDVRFVAKKTEAVLAESGIGDTAYIGPEAEFFIFDDLRFSQNEYSSFHEIDSAEGIWNSGDIESNQAYRPRHKEGYFPTPPHDSVHEIRNDMVRTLMKCGFFVERHHHEVATAGQCEINFKYDTMVKSADNMMLFKYIIKNTAKNHGKVATFMPKPLFNDNGSGMHTHMSIWKHGKNTFAGEEYAGLSKEALYFIGGLLNHSAALSAIINPTTNSYKRLVPGFEAPVNLVYSHGNRSAAIRIPLTEKENTAAKRVEFRPPDPAANPYLAFSALILAGIDGIKKKTDPGEAIDENIYELSKDRLGKIKKMPCSLEESLSALESDHSFLLGPFSKDLIQTWIEYKREKEISAISLRPHPWEYHLYHDV